VKGKVRGVVPAKLEVRELEREKNEKRLGEQVAFYRRERGAVPAFTAKTCSSGGFRRLIGSPASITAVGHVACSIQRKLQGLNSLASLPPKLIGCLLLRRLQISVLSIEA